MPRLLLWSDSVCSATGFARVARTICASLPVDWDIIQVGINHPGRLVEHPRVRVYPTTKDDVWGENIAKEIYQKVDFDLFLVIQDTHIAHTYDWATSFEQIKGHRKLAGKTTCPTIFHYPVDGYTLKASSFNHFADYNVCATAWGREVMSDQIDASKVAVIGHSVDTEVFHTLPTPQRHALKKAIFGIGPDEGLTVMSIGINCERKDHFSALASIKKFNKEQLNGKLYLHTQTIRDSVDLTAQIAYLGLTSLDCKLAGADLLGCSDTALNQLYNASDVLINTSRREGFGIPIIEAMAAGVEVLAPNYGPFVELTEKGKYGHLHTTHGPICWSRGENRGPGWQTNPENVALHLAHIKEAKDNGLRDDRISNARRHVLQNYSEPVIIDQWRALIQEVMYGN